jgi:hypothetical protein
MHLPPFLVDSDVGLALLIVTGALIPTVAVFFRIVIIWLYSGSGRSGLIVAPFHSAYNSATSLGEQRFTGELVSGFALLYAVGTFVVLLVVFTRGRLAYEPERAGSRATEAGE